MRNINCCFFVLFLFFSGAALASSYQSGARYRGAPVSDTTSIALRDFSHEKIGDFKQNRDFNYGTEAQLKLNLLQRFLRWLSRYLPELSGFPGPQPWLRTLFYILIGAIILYAIMKLAKADIRKVFYRSPDRGNLAFEVVDEDIHQMDFDALIEDAINQKEYKKAIRLYYLYALKKLADRDLIHWKPGKTNHEYEQELASAEIKPSFGDLSYYFDYAWYGDFPVSQPMFDRVRVIFRDFKATIDIK